MSKDKPAPEKRPDIKDRAEKEKDAETMDEKAKAKAKIPDPPVCDPALGDLTPAYIEWMKKYHSEDFEARYKDRIPECSEKEDAPDQAETEEDAPKPPKQMRKHGE